MSAWVRIPLLAHFCDCPYGYVCLLPVRFPLFELFTVISIRLFLIQLLAYPLEVKCSYLHEIVFFFSTYNYCVECHMFFGIHSTHSHQGRRNYISMRACTQCGLFGRSALLSDCKHHAQATIYTKEHFQSVFNSLVSKLGTGFGKN